MRAKVISLANFLLDQDSNDTMVKTGERKVCHREFREGKLSAVWRVGYKGVRVISLNQKPGGVVQYL